MSNLAHASPPNLSDPDARKRLSAPGFRTFLAISDVWNLKVAERCVLLGGMHDQTYYARKRDNGDGAPFNYDTMERISLILGIWKAIKLLFARQEDGIRWLKSKNTDMPFSGIAPLEKMLRGSIDDLYSVRRYLDSWRGVWP